MSHQSTATLKLYENETLALAALGVEGVLSCDSVEPSYAPEFPLLVIREIGGVTILRLRSENPARDEPVEVGAQLKRLVREYGRSRIVLNLSGLKTTSS